MENKQLTFDNYFLKIAKTVSLRSKCLSRKIGAVVVQDNAIISSGYNGPARGVKHCNDRSIDFYTDLDKDWNINLYNITRSKPITPEEGVCPRRLFKYKSGYGLHLCQAGHAERNALIQAGRNGVSTKGATLYCWCGQICKDCSIEIVNAGISRLVYLEGTPYDKYSDLILKESGIQITTIKEEEI